MAKVTMKNQSLSMKLLMFFFPSIFASMCVQIIALIQGTNLHVNEIESFFAKLAGFCLRSFSHQPVKPPIYYVSLIVGALIILAVVSYRNEIVSRYLLAFNIYMIVIALGNLLVSDSLVWLCSYYFALILLSVFVCTMLYTESGFIGQQFKKRSNMIESSCLLLGFLAIAFALQKGETLLLTEWIFFRFTLLHIYNEVKTMTKLERIQQLLLAGIFLTMIFVGIPFFLDKITPEKSKFDYGSLSTEERAEMIVYPRTDPSDKSQKMFDRIDAVNNADQS